MKILSVSDQVEQLFYDEAELSRFRDVDLVLACGDLPPEFLSYLAGTLEKPLYYVRGNHDIRYESKPPMGCLNLHQRIVKFKGLTFLGLEGSRWYNGGPIQYREAQMRWMGWQASLSVLFKGGVDVVISHAPPRRVHDAEDRCHRGFRSFHGFIKRHKPAYWIHGHIHAHFDRPEDRVTRVGETLVVNTFGHYVIETDHG